MAGNKLRAASQMTPGTTTTGEADKLVILDGAGGFIASGHVVQEVRTISSTGITSAVTWSGASIPTISGGAQLLVSPSITPKSATNILRIQVELCIGSNENDALVFGLFRDAISNAIAGSMYNPNPGNSFNTIFPISFTYAEVAGSTSSTSFQVRGGSNSNTWSMNASKGTTTVLLGGVQVSSIVVTEIAV